MQTNNPPLPFISKKTAAIFIAVMAELFLLSATVPTLGHKSRATEMVTVGGTVENVPQIVRRYGTDDVVIIILMILPLALVIAGTLTSRKVPALIGWVLLIALAVMHFLS